MARLLLLAAFYVIFSLADATRPFSDHFFVTGKVFCDNCKVGFETNITTYIEGASVQIGCYSRKTNNLLFTQNSVTDASGMYIIRVFGDFPESICDVKLLQSSQEGCKEPILGREASRVSLTHFNGIASNERYANALGFMAEKTHEDCSRILQQYVEDDEK